MAASDDDTRTLTVSMTADELRYVIACGAALAQNVPERSLPTYSGFNKAQIIAFSTRLREVLDAHGLDM